MAAGDSTTAMSCGIRNYNNNINIHHLATREETFVPSFNPTGLSPEQSTDALSPLLPMPYPDLYGPVSDITVPSFPEFSMGLHGIYSLIGNQLQTPVPGACDYGEELFGFVPDLKPLYRDTWVQNSKA